MLKVGGSAPLAAQTPREESSPASEPRLDRPKRHCQPKWRLREILQAGLRLAKSAPQPPCCFLGGILANTSDVDFCSAGMSRGDVRRRRAGFPGRSAPGLVEGDAANQLGSSSGANAKSPGLLVGHQRKSPGLLVGHQRKEPEAPCRAHAKSPRLWPRALRALACPRGLLAPSLGAVRFDRARVDSAVELEPLGQ